MGLTQVVSRLPRLVTHEDGKVLHMHKVLGIGALVHFAYRAWREA